ncbi:uncharacterized protein LOC130718484 [Lotus japonicus]|uniref:uncharacterized protein LOC130718484 n=1 Tax=Lotus japonicus TaxID=34305 RepID=UPI0025905573|nr:uncharacterized protein LOC130718484 [Lotus japonicus]
MQPDIDLMFNGGIEVHSLHGSEELSPGEPQKFLNSLAMSAKILTSSNGLVLCRSRSRESEVQLFICNLITKTWLPIATPKMLLEAPGDDVYVAFECTNNNLDVDDYRIILFEMPLEWSSHLDLKVYLPKEGVWKAMERSFIVGSRNMRLDMPVILHNNLHIISNCSPYLTPLSPYYRPYIMTYNFESGQSTMLRLPKDAIKGSHDDSCNMGIFEWGKKAKNLDRSICLVRLRKSVFIVWILVEYGSTLWRRILKIRVKDMKLEEEDQRVQGFTVMSGDCLIFATETNVYEYDLCGEHLPRAKKICEHNWRSPICFTSYSNTLRPCGTGATTIDGYVTTHS